MEENPFTTSFGRVNKKVIDRQEEMTPIYDDFLSYYKKKKGIRVLVAIDDVAKSKDMVDFIKAYQGFIIDKHDVYLLMTGLRKNITTLQSKPPLTFLARAPKLQLKPLSIWAIASSYQSTFEISQEESLVLAKETKGYAMAFQVLGDSSSVPARKPRSGRFRRI